MLIVGFPILTTFIGLLSRVNSLMHDKLWTITNGFPTIIAFIKFLPRWVLWHRKVGAITKDLPILITFIGFFTSVNSLLYNEMWVFTAYFPYLWVFCLCEVGCHKIRHLLWLNILSHCIPNVFLWYEFARSQQVESSDWSLFHTACIYCACSPVWRLWCQISHLLWLKVLLCSLFSQDFFPVWILWWSKWFLLEQRAYPHSFQL